MGEKMLAYIKEQPQVWLQILKDREALLAGFQAAHGGKKPPRVVLVGSGSSHFASLMAKEFFELELSIPVTAEVPTRLKAALRLAEKGTQFWMVSQTGKSTSTLRAVQQIQQAGFAVTALTADLSSPLAALCGEAVEIRCGVEEVGPKTKGVTATLLTLYLMGLSLCGAHESTLPGDIARSAELAEENLRRSLQWIEEAGDPLSRAPYCLIAADGVGTAAARECAIKLLENLYVPAVSYEFEEYLHGVQYTIDKNSHLFLLCGDGPNRERMLRLMDFHEEKGGHSYLISFGRPAGRPGELFIPTCGSPFTLPFEILLPFQLIGAVISEKKGIECDIPKFPEFYARLDTRAGARQA